MLRGRGNYNDNLLANLQQYQINQFTINVIHWNVLNTLPSLHCTLHSTLSTLHFEPRIMLQNAAFVVVVVGNVAAAAVGNLFEYLADWFIVPNSGVSPQVILRIRYCALVKQRERVEGGMEK